MYSDIAFYINSLPVETRFLIYFIMIVSIPLLLWLDHIVENIKWKRRIRKCGDGR